MVEVVEYESEEGKYPFSIWFNSLNVQAALKVRTAIGRMESGNFSNVKSVGAGAALKNARAVILRKRKSFGRVTSNVRNEVSKDGFKS